MTELSTYSPRRSRHRHRRVTPRLVDSVSQAARTLGVSELTVRRHIKLGTVPAVQIGGTWRIPIAEGDRIAQLPEECTIHEVANSFNVSELTVRRWIHGGHFPAAKRGRTWVVLRTDIEGILSSYVLSHPAGTARKVQLS